MILYSLGEIYNALIACGLTFKSGFYDLKYGMEPLIEPFAIVPSDLYREEWDCTKKEIERNGAFLYNNEHWNYF